RVQRHSRFAERLHDRRGIEGQAFPDPKPVLEFGHLALDLFPPTATREVELGPYEAERGSEIVAAPKRRELRPNLRTTVDLGGRNVRGSQVLGFRFSPASVDDGIDDPNARGLASGDRFLDSGPFASPQRRFGLAHDRFDRVDLGGEALTTGRLQLAT